MRAPSELARLREFLTWLFRNGEPLYGEVIQTVVDVDRAEDMRGKEIKKKEWQTGRLRPSRDAGGLSMRIQDSIADGEKHAAKETNCG